MNAINTLIFWILKQICHAYEHDSPRKIQHFKANQNNFQTGYTDIASKVSDFFYDINNKKKTNCWYKLKIGKKYLYSSKEKIVAEEYSFSPSGVKLCATLNISHTHHY